MQPSEDKCFAMIALLPLTEHFPLCIDARLGTFRGDRFQDCQVKGTLSSRF